MELHKPRILILSTAYLPLIGGSELAIKHLTDRMPDLTFDMVTARFDQTAAREKIGNVRVFRVGKRLGMFSLGLPKIFLPLAMAFGAWRLMRRHHYALIHVFQASQAGGAGRLLKWLYPAMPLLVTLQEGKDMRHQSFVVHFFRSLIIRGADAVTVISTYLERYVRSVEPLVSIRLVPNGVDLEVFSRPVAPEVLAILRRQIGIERGVGVILSVSRLVEKNGLPNLIRAFKEAEDSLNAHLVLIGSGPLRLELQEFARRLGMNSRIAFLGDVPHEQVPHYLHLADVFVRSSLSEGLGTAFLEAMAAGVPVVGSDVGGISDFLRDGQTGLVCDPNDPHSIADAMARALQDLELSATLRENALRLIRERYSWDIIARQMYDTYRSLL